MAAGNTLADRLIGREQGSGVLIEPADDQLSLGLLVSRMDFLCRRKRFGMLLQPFNVEQLGSDRFGIIPGGLVGLSFFAQEIRNYSHSVSRQSRQIPTQGAIDQRHNS